MLFHITLVDTTHSFHLRKFVELRWEPKLIMEVVKL